MLSARSNWLVLACTAAAQLISTGCSVDASGHPGRRKACNLDAGDQYYGGFCLVGDHNAGHVSDAGGNADSGAPKEPCQNEGDRRPCYTGDSATYLKGECKAGFETCDGTFWGKCEGETLPTDEICDGQDNDCDSKIDEETSGDECSAAGQGVCASGLYFCFASAALQCIAPPPQAESCEDLEADRNCDGIPASRDPELDTPCYEPTSPSDKGCTELGGVFSCVGDCRPGKRHCAGACEGAVYPRDEAPTEIPDGGLPDGTMPEVHDEDCDGRFDENFDCASSTYACYDGPPGTKGRGICHAGTRSCTDAGVSAECVGQQMPLPETCTSRNQMLDNDCDGIAGNVPDLGKPCGDPDSKNQCTRKATWECEGAEKKCLPAAVGLPETCDGIDNNCDGGIDETCGSGEPGNKCCGADGLVCTDTDRDNQNCGDCGVVCNAGSGCCNGSCKNFENDNDNCGGCGIECRVLNVLGIEVPGTCRNRRCSL